ncbi:hypothetical protein GGS20DRAFT_575516 [Poronia punctata]|nr:hypothetical protein GGS20DRAFT_575516 [Poronia punctata]
MKFGDRLEEASVPGWSLHNVDYNSLKHQIKVHTTKDQATAAIAIPGQPDYTLRRFEDAFYLELCSQHNRVGLFVTSKADEVSRRLRYLSGLVHQLLLKCADTRGLSGKRQQRFIKYYLRVEECGQDINALMRFVDAQVTAFRKILKKYKKWTGSTTLSSRFKDNVLTAPKSFTSFNFTPLQLQYRELHTTLGAAAPESLNVHAISTPARPPTESRRNCNSRRLSACHDSLRSSNNTSVTHTPNRGPTPSPTNTPPVTRYWNEYDHGSEAGDQDDTYVIYIDPDADDKFPGLSYVKNMVGAPVDRVRQWLHAQKHKDAPSTQGTISGTSSETQSLLGTHRPSHSNAQGRGSRSRANTGSSTAAPPTDYFSISAGPFISRVGHNNDTGHDNENEPTEDGYVSSEEGGQLHDSDPASDFLSSPSEYMMKQYQDKVLSRTVIISYVAAFVFLGISTLLVVTGRHHLRLEVDAGATVGSVMSLFCACVGLGAKLYRQYPSGRLYSLAVWTVFLALCVLNGMLLILVVDSSGL